MATTLETDLIGARQELAAAREELLETLTASGDAALDRARRGGWTVRRVLQHLIEAEWFYGQAVCQLRGLAPPPASATGSHRPDQAAAEQGPAVSRSDALRRLSESRQRLLAALDGIDEACFYHVGSVGHEEYSVLSVLENVASHDREHARQIRSIAATG